MVPQLIVLLQRYFHITSTGVAQTQKDKKERIVIAALFRYSTVFIINVILSKYSVS